MNGSRRAFSGLLAVAVAFSMSACGGGGGGSSTPKITPTPVPTPTPTPTATPTPPPSGTLEGCNASPSTTKSVAISPAGNGSDGRRRLPARSGTGYVPGVIGVLYRTGAIRAQTAGSLSRIHIAGQDFSNATETSWNRLGQTSSAITVAAGTEDQILAQVRRDPNVMKAARIARRYKVASVPPTPLPVTQAYFPVTPGVMESNGLVNEGQWDMHFIGADSAWGFSTQVGGIATLGAGKTIAMIDTGADTNHPSISTKIVGTKCFINGATDPTGTTATSVSDLDGHGTNTAGIAAAMGTIGTTNDGYGFVGTAFSSNLYIYKVFPNPPATGCDSTNQNNAACGADARDIATALNDIAANKTAQVASLSLGGPADPTYEEPAVANAIANGIVVVAAAGNGDQSGLGLPALSYPAADPGVIAVGATSLNDLSPGLSPSAPALYVSSYSNWGTTNAQNSATSWGIVAPGGDPITANNFNDNDVEHWVHNIYSSMTVPTIVCTKAPVGTNPNPVCRVLIAGTSQATPHVAGAVALLLGAPNAPAPSAVFAALCAAADPVGTVVLPGIKFPPARPDVAGTGSAAGCGELNVYRAMAKQLTGTDPMTPGSLTL